MKRVGCLYPFIADPDNIRLAFLKAAKGKHDRKEVIRFKTNLESNISNLYCQLQNGCLNVGRYRFFNVYDPKKRWICAACFPERILHHAIMNVCEPVLDKYAINDSYACRKGKGPRRAVHKAQQFARRYRWYLKLDIAKYFDSIDHDLLRERLSRRIKDKGVLKLFDQIFKTYETQKGKGLPIGNLVSQHLANFYLSFFDHWIKEVRKIRGYIRYMDDFILFGEGKEALKLELIEIHLFLKTHLKLTLNPKIQVNKCKNGIPFLGYRVFPSIIRLTARSKQRFVKKFRQYENKQRNGKWSIRTLTAHMEPLIDFTRMADAEGFRREIIKRYGVLS
jgi:retron-type reverse transcriptase